jgi:hypothetical protein
MKPVEALHKAAEIVGTNRKLAKAIHMPQSTLQSILHNVSGMEDVFRDYSYAILVEKVTNGKIEARQLCPKRHKIINELEKIEK